MRRMALVVAGLLLLSACAGGETVWPNLATVPERPKEFSTPEDRQALKERLERDRQEAGGISTELSPPVEGEAPAADPDAPPVPSQGPPLPPSDPGSWEMW
ncbi:MAG: hypothetical protein M3O22_01225 [Pseudomonadota bacterium]|nr:hypothetical protein [Pseudomonadota bacterium]